VRAPGSTRRRLLLPVAILFLSLGGRPAGTTAADEDRTLRVGTIEDFDSINPNLAFIGSSAEASNIQYDPLVGLGPDLDYAKTGFAEAWTQAGTTWTFTIRDGMRWSDGEPADANDVAFTFRYLLTSMDPTYIGPWAPRGNDLPRVGATRADGRPDHPLSLYGEVVVRAAGLRSVQLVDAHTVTLTTARPTTLLLGALVPILPEHIWSTVPFVNAATDFQSAPPVVGSGPFQLVEWQRGTSARFVRNPDYWGERPFIDEVQFRFYPDRAALAAALERGEIDYARGVAPGDVDRLDAEPDIATVEGRGSGFTHLAYNTYAKPIDGGGASTSAVRDPKFRDALGYALDRAEIIDAAVEGHATPGTTLIPPGVVAFHTEPSKPRRFDVEEATRRLEAAGYVDADEDGVREDLDGRPIHLRLVYPTSDPKYAAAAVAVADDWERVGMGVTPTGLEPDTLDELLYVPEVGGTAEYDVELWSWSGSPDPDFLLSLLTTGQIGRDSDSNYSNPAYDRLFDAQRAAATVDERREIVRRMLDVAYDQAPIDVLFYDDELHAHRTDRFGDWSTTPAEGGTSLFTSGVQGYLDLVPASTVATPSPSATEPAPTMTSVPSPSAAASGGLLGYPSGDATLGLIGALLGVVALILVLIARRMRGGTDG
jgi:peptide/nickel transport system substrate-binding protein